MNFIHSYETKDHVYDTDTVFCNGGSLIFARFVVGLHVRMSILHKQHILIDDIMKYNHNCLVRFVF
jgi:hypothetical protein